MTTITTGLTEGDFTALRVLSGGQMTDILTLLNSAGGGITTAATPLSIASGVLSVDLAAYATSAAVNALLADYRLTASLFSGVTVAAGMVAVIGNGTISIGLTGTESRAQLSLIDSGGTVRNLVASLGTGLVWNGEQLATLTNLATKQATLTAGAGAFLNGSTLAGYDLRWLTNGTPTWGDKVSTFQIRVQHCRDN